MNEIKKCVWSCGTFLIAIKPEGIFDLQKDMFKVYIKNKYYP